MTAAREAKPSGDEMGPPISACWLPVGAFERALVAASGPGQSHSYWDTPERLHSTSDDIVG